MRYFTVGHLGYDSNILRSLEYTGINFPWCEIKDVGFSGIIGGRARVYHFDYKMELIKMSFDPVSLPYPKEG